MQKNKRTFTIHEATHTDGCQTKFKSKDYTGVYVSTSPSGAARKALTQLCRVKKIHGQCALYITIRETTQGSAKKLLSYKLNRVKLTKPLELKGRVINYTSTAKSVDSIPKCKSGSRKSSGPKRRSRAKHAKHNMSSTSSRAGKSKSKKSKSKKI